MDGQRVSVKEAARVLGLPEKTIRYRLEREMNTPADKKLFPIGQAHRSISGKHKSLRYDIYKGKLMEYAGLTEWPAE